MASGYTSQSATVGSFTVRFYWSSSYNASTNKSTITVTPQVYNTGYYGGDLWACGYNISSPGIYLGGSRAYSFDASWGTGYNLKCSANQNSWTNFLPYTGSISTITVSHNSSGAASTTVRFLGTIVPMNYESYKKSLDSGNLTISFTESAPYSITYNANGGSGAPSSQGVYATFTYTLSSTRPTRTGYTFLGWSTSSTATTATYQPGASVTPNGNLALYAVWSINSYAATPTAGDYIDSVSGGGSKQYNSSVSFSAVLGSATGYTYAFDGWYSGDTKVSGDNPYTFTMPASAVDLTAKGTRSANSYTVHFDANGGTGAMSDEGFTYDQAQALTANSFTRTGYTFLGWSTNSSAVTPTYSDEQSVSNLAPSGTVTLYAVWQLNTYQLSISTSHGSVSVVRDDSPIGNGSIGALSNGATLYYNDELTITFTAATGYTISTHTVNGSTFTSGNTFIATGAVTIVQTSTANTYTVVFNANRSTGSGGGTMANQTFTYDAAQNLTANAFTRFYTATFDANSGEVETPTSNVYCSFIGWGKTESDAVQYANQESVTNLAPSGSITLYAKWQYGRVVFPEPTRTGYTFKGWYDAATGGNKIANAGGSVVLSANTTFYAQWDAITYPLSLTSSDNGVVVNVLRTASPYAGGPTGLLNDGDTLYYGDVLSITFSISEGYQKRSATVNGTDFGGEYSGSMAIASVQSAVTVVVEVKLGAIVYIGNEAYQAFIGNADASAYEQYEGFFGNAGGTNWDAY